MRSWKRARQNSARPLAAQANWRSEALSLHRRLGFPTPVRDQLLIADLVTGRTVEPHHVLRRF